MEKIKEFWNELLENCKEQKIELLLMTMVIIAAIWICAGELSEETVAANGTEAEQMTAGNEDDAEIIIVEEMTESDQTDNAQTESETESETETELSEEEALELLRRYDRRRMAALGSDFIIPMAMPEGYVRPEYGVEIHVESETESKQDQNNSGIENDRTQSESKQDQNNSGIKNDRTQSESKQDQNNSGIENDRTQSESEQDQNNSGIENDRTQSESEQDQNNSGIENDRTQSESEQDQNSSGLGNDHTQGEDESESAQTQNDSESEKLQEEDSTAATALRHIYNITDWYKLHGYELRLPKNSSDEETSDESELENALIEKLASYDGDWSVYVKNLKTGTTITINDRPMKSASVMKLFILGTVYKAFESGDLQRTDEVVELMKNMIIYSSNSASNELLYRLGNSDYGRGISKVNAFIQEYGFSDMTVEYNGFGDSATVMSSGNYNQVSAKDCGKLLEDIYRREWVSRSVSNEIEQMMLNQDTRYKIPAGLPDGVACGNKSGEMDTTENDAAIIYADSCDYILVVLSSDWSSKDQAITRIKDISALVYQYLAG